ncbi:MAPEG family protein [Aquabacterium sp. CECT 9606]|uniref:MAPEG family protein n=1 Tax=Aquabacterium sp. CECT 9606 TaxID=2845822 RepID=UPI001E642664|nr:MAPEG family protein [Aquabacterium sp. CECT 9606]CAH0350824.1 hypothetical protein AQB9606_01751 [Aquabacterium sp. CECT 9606]
MNFEPIHIFQPVTVLAFWTMLVLLQIPIRRFRAAFKGEVGPGDFRFGESGRVPPHVSIPNRNYMNLLELPVLFYAGCVVAYVTQHVDHVLVLLAWVYVALRMAHSVVHLSYNHVIHRLVVFAISNVVLLGFWARLAWPLWR